MVLFEIKKVFFKTSSKISLLLMFALVVVTCYFTMDIHYVNEKGNTETGPAAVSKLKAMQKEWTGYLNEETIRNVITENRRLRKSPEALSDNNKDNEIAYSRGQGIREIRSLLNESFAYEFREYDYYRADSLSEADAPNFYSNRITLLTKWLSDEAAEQFSQEQKEYLIRQYQSIRTPFYYDYMKGWSRLFEFAPTIIMITMLILSYLVAGIFSNEFAWKSDAIFFSSMYGRNKAITAKIKAGLCIITMLYWTAVLLYTMVTLLYLGTDGWACPVQADWTSWKCFYNITVLQKFLLITVGGYIGCLFFSFSSMLISAKTKSAVLAVIFPVVVIFIPSFIGNINSPIINKILGLLPYQLLQMGTALNYFSLYTLRGKIYGAVPILLTLYTTLTIIILPILYREYRRKQII